MQKRNAIAALAVWSLVAASWVQAQPTPAQPTTPTTQPDVAPHGHHHHAPHRPGPGAVEGSASDASSGDRATMTHRFEDAERWSAMFDAPERAEWQKPVELVAALSIRRGQTIAEIGAGTGYFNALWSQAVGEKGVVFAMDVEPNLVAFMRDRADREKTPNVIPVIGSLDTPRLPAGSTDWIALVDVYHHIDHRIAYFTTVQQVLRPGGKVLIVDFREGELPVGPPADHKIAPEQVTREMKEAGFRPAGSIDFLPYQYALLFERQVEGVFE